MAINMEELLRTFGRPNVVEVGSVPQPPAVLPQPARAPVAAPAPMQAPMQAPQAAERPRGLLGGFFGPEGRDARSRLAIGLEGLAMNPNQALIGQLQEGIESRATAAQKNATIQWLLARGHDDLAAALEAGAPVQEVLAESMRRMQPAKPEIREVDNRLVSVSPDGVVKELYAPGAKAPDPKAVMELRKEFSGRDEVKTFGNISRQYSNIASSAQGGTGPSDISLVFSYMKMIDPTSTVGPGEQANATNAGGVPGSLVSIYNQVLGKGTLSPELRAQFVAQAEAIYKNAESAYKPVANYYQGLATTYGYDPNQIVAPLGAVNLPTAPPPSAATTTTQPPPSATQPPPQPTATQPPPTPQQTELPLVRTDADYDALPLGAKFVDEYGNSFIKETP